MISAYFIGIDIGTQGARVVMLDQAGNQLAAKEAVFELSKNSREEQSPDEWWRCCDSLIACLTSELRGNAALQKIKAIAVTSTSGTIIPLDYDCNPLHAAIMYSDPRSGEEAAICRQAATQVLNEGYTGFNSSSGLPKMRWFLNRYPESSSRLYKFIHAADFVTGRLCGEYGITDYTNALKSGFSIHRFEWPEYIGNTIGIQKKWLPSVKPSGTPLHPLNEGLAVKWGFPPGVVVTTGMTDGCASQVASGAVSPGQWNTTIGTTMVVKGITRKEVLDPAGAIYNHRHPAGYWMPGGASNTGADWISRLFAGKDLRELGTAALDRLPTPHLAWPLLQEGERFPFVAPKATGFWPEADKVELFAACMEGVAFIERYAYERITGLSGEKIDKVFTAGGGSNSDTWLRIRSSVINRPVCRMKNVSGAAGAAILAASQTYYSSLEQAASQMVVPDLVIEPEHHWVSLYDQKYLQFVGELKARKILS